jgi:hypothetical protein
MFVGRRARNCPTPSNPLSQASQTLLPAAEAEHNGRLKLPLLNETHKLLQVVAQAAAAAVLVAAAAAPAATPAAAARLSPVCTGECTPHRNVRLDRRRREDLKQNQQQCRQMRQSEDAPSPPRPLPPSRPPPLPPSLPSLLSRLPPSGFTSTSSVPVSDTPNTCTRAGVGVALLACQPSSEEATHPPPGNATHAGAGMQQHRQLSSPRASW